MRDSGAVGEKLLDLADLGLQRLRDLATAIAEFPSDFERSRGQGLVERLRSLVEAGVDPRQERFERMADFVGRGRSALFEGAELHVERFQSSAAIASPVHCRAG